MNSRISIIVPVYNAKEYLKQCVDSILAQDYENLEVILVDDGATDGSGEMCDAYACENVKVVHKENGGLISAWKLGVEESSGKYLSFVDSDDWIDSDMISKLAEHLSGVDGEVICSDYIIERDNGTSDPVYETLTPGEYDRTRIEQEVALVLLGCEHRPITISRCMKLIERSLIEKNMHYSNPSIAFGEDTTVMLPSLLDASRIYIMDHKAFYHYRYVGESMVHKYDAGLFENICALKIIIDEIISDRFEGTSFLDMQKRANMELVQLLLLAVKNEARGNPEEYRTNIRGICADKKVKDAIAFAQIDVSDKSNKLLYRVLKNPSSINLTILRLAMIYYYKIR